MDVPDDRVWTTARADAGAIPRQWRHGRLLVPVTRGHFVHVDDAADQSARLAAILEAVPAAALSHWTAAAVWGAPIQQRHLCVVHVTVPTGAIRPARAGVVAHHARDHSTEVHDGLRLTSAVRTWLDLAAVGAATTDLVVVADALCRLGRTTPERLADCVELPRRRGRLRMHEALEQIDPRSESGPETRLRLVLVRAGLPRPEVNHVIRDPATGAFVARVDLAWPDARLVVEYDGDHHREQAQWGRDLRRRERLEALGWTVVVLTAADLRGDQRSLVRRVSTRLRAA